MIGSRASAADERAQRRGRGWPRQRPLRARAGQRGGALVVTVLVAIAMTGLALVAVTSAQVEMRLAHNHRDLKQAQYVAETGMMAAIQRIQGMGGTSLLRERDRLQAQSPDQRINFNLSSFGEGAVFVLDEDPQLSSLGATSKELDFLVEVESLQTIPAPPGYQINLDQQSRSLEVGLLATGRIGQIVQRDEEGLSSNAGYSSQRVWALVPVP